MPWVVDVSITMAWCFEDERTPETDALLARLENDPATVTQLWHLEVANVLLQAQRRKEPRITPEKRSQFLELLAHAPINVDPFTVGNAWSTVLQLAETHKLTAYDAAYLELALRLGAELASLDVELRTAAKAAGVTVIP